MSRMIKLGGLDLPILPTPLAKLAKMMPALEKDELFTEEGATALGEAIFHGIRRAGGEVTQVFVHENIDMLNMHEVFEVFFAVNGMVRKKAGAVGEAEAGAAS